MKIPKLKAKKITDFFRKLPRIAGEKSLLTFFILLFFALVVGCFVFYKYNSLVEKREREVSETPLKFQEKTYQDILKIWQEKEEKFEEADSKTYPDPFLPL